MDIELKDKANKKIKIPMLPEEIEYSSSARFQEYKILDLGREEICVPINGQHYFPAAQEKKCHLSMEH